MSGTLSEVFISVDIESAGPNPADYSLLAIGACTLEEPPQTFYIELKPVHASSTAEALAVHGLSLEALQQSAWAPEEALRRFEAWLKQIVPAGHTPIMVAFNAPFDWMFLCDYFHRFLGHNPFGHTALDIKAFYMGRTGSRWSETSRREIAERLPEVEHLTHNALEDALDQAALFRRILAIQRLPQEKSESNH